MKDWVKPCGDTVVASLRSALSLYALVKEPVRIRHSPESRCGIGVRMRAFGTIALTLSGRFGSGRCLDDPRRQNRRK